MPLIKGKSPKAFEHNIKAEMHSGKPQDQALAIAYSVKRKAKKKASGGMVKSGSRDMDMARGGRMMADGGIAKDDSAASERRPMPDQAHNDQMQVSHNKAKKALIDSDWTGQPTVRQSQSNPRVQPIKHPRMVPSDAFSSRLYDQEGKLQDSAGVNDGPQRQPPKDYDEEGADRQGPSVPDMADEHSTHRKPYAKGGQIEASDSRGHNIDHPTSMEPDENDMYNNPDRDDSPSEDEGSDRAHSRNEMAPDRQGPKVPDMEREHSNGRMPYAEGGDVDDDRDYDVKPAKIARPDGGYGAIIAKADGGMIDDSEDQPTDEEDMEHHDSIAAAIMAKRDRMKSGSDSDIDKMMADGGIASHDSIYSDDSDQADLSRNADEDANEEDQLSYNALRKENYNESEGLSQLDSPDDSNEHGHDLPDEDSHDMVDSIRRKMAMRRQFKVR